MTIFAFFPEMMPIGNVRVKMVFLVGFKTSFCVCERMASILAELCDGCVFQSFIIFVFCSRVFLGLERHSLEAVGRIPSVALSSFALFVWWNEPLPVFDVPLSRTLLRYPSRAWPLSVPEHTAVSDDRVWTGVPVRLQEGARSGSRSSSLQGRDLLRRCPPSTFKLRHVKGIATSRRWSRLRTLPLI